jgi:hypothetical protein
MGGEKTKTTVDANFPEGTEIASSDYDDEVDVHRVSDAVALQACRAYLVRKKRLGEWPKHRERQERLMRSSLRYRMQGDAESASASSGNAGTSDDDGSNPSRGRTKQQQQQREKDRPSHIGYFWEDPSELKYYVTPRRRRLWTNVQSSKIDPRTEQVTNPPDDDGDQISRAAPDDKQNLVRDALFAYDFDNVDSRIDGVVDDDLDEEYVGSWEFISHRPHTPEEDAVVDDLCDDLMDESDEFLQRDDDAVTSVPDDSMGGGYFYDDFPPASYVRRSQAAKRSWSDPEFRRRWYKARWGADLQQKRERLSKKRDPYEGALTHRRATPGGIPKPPSSSPSPPLLLEAVANMSEDEIAHAIRTYLSSRQKRKESRLQTMKERRRAQVRICQPSPPSLVASDDSPTPSSPGLASLLLQGAAAARSSIVQSLLPTEHDLQRKRLERSERATRAYQTRLANQQERKTDQHVDGLGGVKRTVSGSAATSAESSDNSQKKDYSPERGRGSSSASAKRAIQALAKVKTCLDSGEVPSAADVERVLEPAKLPGRKRVLVRLIAECFGLRGKCVPFSLPLQPPQIRYGAGSAFGTGAGPIVIADGRSNVTFVTTASIEQLGSFCLHLIRNHNSTR